MTTPFAASAPSAPAAAPTPSQSAPASPVTDGVGPAHRRFTAAEYHAMGRAGILDEKDRVDLLNGELVQMPPIGDWHNGKVARLNQVLLPLPHRPGHRIGSGGNTAGRP